MNKQEQDFKEIKRLLLTFLKDDDRVDTWLNSTNGNFGYFVPMDLIRKNRGHKVLFWIQNALEENNG